MWAAAPVSSSYVGASFEDLPDETLVQIFQNLPVQQLLSGIPTVCKWWNGASREPQLWMNISVQRGWRKGKEDQGWREFAVEQCKLFLRGDILNCKHTITHHALEGAENVFFVFDDSPQIAGFYRKEGQESDKSQLAVWDMATGEMMQRFPIDRTSLGFKETRLCASYVATRKKFSKSSPSYWKLLHPNGKKTTIPSEAESIACHPSFLAVVEENQVVIFDPESGDKIETYPLAGDRSGVNLQFFGDRLVCSKPTGAVEIFDFKAGFVGAFHQSKYASIQALSRDVVVEAMLLRKPFNKGYRLFNVRDLASGAIIHSFEIKTGVLGDGFGGIALLDNIVAVRESFHGLTDLFMVDIKAQKMEKILLPQCGQIGKTTKIVWDGHSLLIVGENSLVQKIDFAQ